MALSAAMQWALANGMTEADVYKNINDFLATNPDAATTQAQMAQYGISPQDVAAATGGTSGGLLSGNIMAGASWNSTNTALQDALTQATGQQTSNYAVGGSTTTDTLNQLNTFLAGGGQFDPNATVYLQAGGVDFIQGVDKAVVKDNLNQIVKTLGDQGVNVVLTGSPYAKSVEDVINNNFDPKVDQIYNDVAKANSNVALVGTQGEILQNKKLLVDALHTNAEGTAIYNQSVIDALSQFKNEVPASTPQAIAEVQKTNTVATTPPVITQAASNPAVAQTLAAKTGSPDIQSLIASGALQPNQATLIGDTYYQPIYTQLGSGEDAQLGPLENVVTYKANQNQTGGNVNWFDPTGQYQQTTQQQKVPSFLGGLADVANDPFVQAALLASGAGGALGNALGLTGTTANAVGTGLLKGGAAAAGGADIGDALKAGLLSGGLVYGAGALDNYLATGSTADVGITERQLAIADAKQLAAQGLSQNQIADVLGSSGYNEVMVDSAIRAATKGLTSATIPTSTATDVVNVTGTATPAISTGGLLSSLVPTSTAVSTPVTNAGTVNVTGTAQPQQIDQSVMNLINSQLAANVKTPANLANVQVTGTADKGMMSGNNTANVVLNALTGLPTTAATVTPTTTTPTVNVTAQKPVTTQDITTASTSLLQTPTTTATTPTVNVTAQTPTVNTNNIVSAITAALPAVTTTTTPSTVSTTVPTQTITAQKPVTIQEATSIVTSLIPNITPAQAATVAEQVITSNSTASKQDVASAITAALPSIVTPAVTTPTVTVTAPKTTTPTLSDVVAPITAALPTVTTPAAATSTIPTQTITAQKPTTINDVVTPAIIPLIQPSTPLEVTPVTSNKTNELGLTDAQMFNLLKGGLGLLGGLGGAAALSGKTSSGGIGALPTQGVPLYSQDYFNQIQQNYNRILPAVPRDVASPLRDWYLSQYGA